MNTLPWLKGARLFIIELTSSHKRLRILDDALVRSSSKCLIHTSSHYGQRYFRIWPSA